MSEHKVRRRIAGLSLVGAPLLLFAADLFGPEPSSNAATAVSRAAADADVTFITGIVGLVGAILLVPE